MFASKLLVFIGTLPLLWVIFYPPLVWYRLYVTLNQGVNNDISRSGENYFERRCTEGCNTCITFVREDDRLLITLYHEQSFAAIWFDPSDRNDSGKFRIQSNATNDKGSLWKGSFGYIVIHIICIICNIWYKMWCIVCSFPASI